MKDQVSTEPQETGSDLQRQTVEQVGWVGLSYMEDEIIPGPEHAVAVIP